MLWNTIVTFFSVLLGFHSNWQTLTSAACPTSARTATASTRRDLTPVNATTASPSPGEASAKVTCMHKRRRTHNQVHITAQSYPDLFVCCHELMCSPVTKHMYFPLVEARKKKYARFVTACLYMLAFVTIHPPSPMHIVWVTTNSIDYFLCPTFSLSRCGRVHGSQLLSQRRLRQHYRLLPVPGLRARTQARRWQMRG